VQMEHETYLSVVERTAEVEKTRNAKLINYSIGSVCKHDAYYAHVTVVVPCLDGSIYIYCVPPVRTPYLLTVPPNPYAHPRYPVSCHC
jgi:hypothetical protein